MKWKKSSLPMLLAATLLVGGIAAAFATSPANASLAPVPGTPFTDEEYAQLSALCFDGYQRMTVSEFQHRVWTLTDNPEYRDLLERFSQDKTLWQLRSSNETAAFLFYTLEPLTSQRWNKRSFDGSVESTETGRQPVFLEYVLTETILNPDKVTVGDYGHARETMIRGLKKSLQTFRPLADLPDGDFEEVMSQECRDLEISCSSDSLLLELEYVLQLPDCDQLSPGDSDAGILDSGDEEARNAPYGTADDYRSLLALRTPDYQNMPLRTFNQTLLDWANEDYERMERINVDAGRNDFQAELTEEDMSFVRWTIRLSGEENGMKVRSLYTGQPEKDPWFGSFQLDKAKDGAWCTLWYQFSYHVADKDALTVGKRDQAVLGFVQAIQNFWDETPLSDLVKLTESDVALRMRKLAEVHSTNLITIVTDTRQIQFEHDVPPPDHPD